MTLGRAVAGLALKNAKKTCLENNLRLCGMIVK